MSGSRSPQGAGAGAGRFRALIFDLDGVLLDTEPLHTRAKEMAFEEFGIAPPADLYDAFRGRSDADMVGHVVAELGPPGLSVAEVLARKHALFRTLHPEIEPVPGAREFLHRARRTFSQMALTTSATPENREFALARLGLEGFFDVVVDASHTPRTKPHPEPYLQTVARLGRRPPECLVVEDSTNGVLSGRGAGCAVAAITTSFTAAELSAAGAEEVIDDYAALASWLGLP